MKRTNSFDFIRLLAALMVVFSHSFALTGHAEPIIGNVKLGTLGVWIFFIVSGYFISSSWDQYPRFNVFFAKRALRIFPGLIVALLVTTLICGIFYSTLLFSDFLGNPSTLSYLNNILLFNSSFTLPGVFTGNIYPSAVNGSIWTLAYEFSMYIAVALLGALGVYKKISIIKIWGSLFTLEFIMIIVGTKYFEYSLFYLNLSLLLPLALLFFTGILMHKETKRIKLKISWGLISLAAFLVLATLTPNLSPLYATVFLGYAIFSLGKSSRMSWVGKYGDFSYGIYIYSFPIQQMVVASTQSRNSYKVFLVSAAISTVVAALSWYLVESKALRLKKKINTKRYPLLQADEAW